MTLQLQLVDAPQLGGSATSTRPTGKRQDSGASQDTFYKMTLQFERKYSPQGSRAPCHVSFGFFFGFFGIFLPRLQMDPQPEPTAQPKARGLLHIECDFTIALHISFGFKTTRALLKTFEGSTRGRLGLLEKTSRLLRHQLEYIPASGCFDYSLGLLTCSTRGRLRTTR
jgi:hypothetical protein